MSSIIGPQITEICLAEIHKRCPHASPTQLDRARALLAQMPAFKTPIEMCNALTWFTDEICSRIGQRSAFAAAPEPQATLHAQQMNVLFDRAPVAPTDLTLSIGNFLGFQNPTDLQLAFNPQSLYRYHYLALDSRFRNRASSTSTEYSWLYSPQTQAPMNGMIMSNNPIVNIIAMRLYKVVLPGIFNGYTRLADETRTATILVKEFDTQITAFSGDLRYHFLGQFVNRIEGENAAPNSIITDDPQSMTFYFRQPIRYLDSITLSFGNPDQLLSFYEDQGTATISYSGDNIYFNLSIQVPRFEFLPWMKVYISGFTMTNPAINQALIDRINALHGVILTYEDPDIFSFHAPDVGADIIDGLEVQIYIASLEIVTYLEFITIPDE